MNRPHERLTPIQLRPKQSVSKESPNFADIVQVNALLEKRSIKNRMKSNSNNNEHFITLASLRNKNVKYENQKQEQYHRLERKGKIQRNSEWMDLMKNEEKPKKANTLNTINPVTQINQKTCFQQIKETNKQIDAANKELDFLNATINKRRSLPVNKCVPSSQSKVILPNTCASKNKISNNTNNARKNLYTKGIYSDKINDLSMFKQYTDKPMLDDEKLINSSFTKIKSKPSHRKLNALRNKRVDATISLVDEKLKKVNNKYFNAEYETHLKTLVQKKPKYRSVKDLLKSETDKLRSSAMEASKIIQTELDKDLNLPVNKEREFAKQNYQTQVLYENLDFLENQVFHDNFSDEEKKEKNKQNKEKQTPSPRSPKFKLASGMKSPVRVFNQSVAASPRKSAQNQMNSAKKDEIKSKNTETMTALPPKTALEAAILKSDYLRKEFNMNSFETNLTTPNFMKMESKPEKQSWSRDIEYLMK